MPLFPRGFSLNPSSTFPTPSQATSDNANGVAFTRESGENLIIPSGVGAYVTAMRRLEDGNYGDLRRRNWPPVPSGTITSYREPFKVGAGETCVQVPAFTLGFDSKRKLGSPDGQVIRMLLPTRVIVRLIRPGPATAQICA